MLAHLGPCASTNRAPAAAAPRCHPGPLPATLPRHVIHCATPSNSRTSYQHNSLLHCHTRRPLRRCSYVPRCHPDDKVATPVFFSALVVLYCYAMRLFVGPVPFAASSYTTHRPRNLPLPSSTLDCFNCEEFKSSESEIFCPSKLSRPSNHPSAIVSQYCFWVSNSRNQDLLL